MSELATNEAPHRPLALPWRAAGFVAAFSVLQLAWQRLDGSRLEYWIIHTCTVVPAALLADFLTPGAGVWAAGYLLQAPGLRLDILNGCDGMEALFLLLAAFAVAPLAWRRRWAGAALGIPLVLALNQVRILVLFYALRANPPLFDTLHATVTPIVLVVLLCCYFHAWLATPSRSARTEAA